VAEQEEAAQNLAMSAIHQARRVMVVSLPSERKHRLLFFAHVVQRDVLSCLQHHRREWLVAASENAR